MSNLELIGIKLGMTREFYQTGLSVPVTVLKMEKARVISVLDKEKRGYSAIQLGFGNIKSSKLTKQMKGYFSKKNTEPRKTLKEIRLENVSDYKEGNEFGIEIFDDVKFVDVKSKTIGKGFAGAMKRHNFSGLRATHGVSISHRSHGSTGQRQDPGKVFKNKKMAGHMGDKFRTVQNLEIIKKDVDNQLLFITIKCFSMKVFLNLYLMIWEKMICLFCFLIHLLCLLEKEEFILRIRLMYTS